MAGGVAIPGASSYWVFTSQAQVLALRSAVDAAMGFPKAGVDVGGGIHAPPAETQTVHYMGTVANGPAGSATAWAYPVDANNSAAVAQCGTQTAPGVSDPTLDATWSGGTYTP